MSKWLGILIGIIAGLSLLFQAWQLHNFMAAGARFTAGDGKVLCERVQKMERALGLPILPCEYW